MLQLYGEELVLVKKILEEFITLGLISTWSSYVGVATNKDQRFRILFSYIVKVTRS